MRLTVNRATYWSIEMKNSVLVRPALITAFILLLPLVAMQFSQQVKWDFFDFIFMGILIFGTYFCFELVARRLQSAQWRMLAAVGFTILLAIVWAQLAVGIFGD